MEPIKKDSSTWWAMRIKDPLVRKQVINNIRAQPEWDEWSNSSSNNHYAIADMFDWDKSIEGYEYWEELHDSKYTMDPSLWSEYPIYDSLPDVYWVENPTPGRAPGEWIKIWEIASGGDTSIGYYKWYCANGNKTRPRSNPRDEKEGLPDNAIVLSYDNWKELVLGTITTGKKEESVEQVPEPWSIVTTDGVTKYLGDEVWWVREESILWTPWSSNLVKSDQISLTKGYKMFSTKDAAEEYKKKQSQPEQVTSTVKESKPADIVWKVGNEIKIISTFPIIKVTDTHISLGGSTPGARDSVYTIEEANDYIRGNLWTMIEKESVPDRKCKVGSKWIVKKDDKIVYTIKKDNGQTVLLEWYSPCNGDVITRDWDVEKLNKAIEEGKWIPYTPEPVPVTVDNAVIGMKVVRGEDWDYSWATNENEVGTISSVYTKIVEVVWSNKHEGKTTWHHRMNGELSVAPENTVTKETVNQTTNNQPTKATSYEKHSNKQENSSICNKDNYTGKIISSWTEEVSIINSTCYKGKTISVHEPTDSIIRGKRTAGTAVAC